MTKRYAALIHFRKEATPAQIAAALNKIKDVIDVPPHTEEPEYFTQNGQKFVRYKPRPFRWSDIVNEYNPEHGTPVFYIP